MLIHMYNHQFWDIKYMSLMRKIKKKKIQLGIGLSAQRSILVLNNILSDIQKSISTKSVLPHIAKNNKEGANKVVISSLFSSPGVASSPSMSCYHTAFCITPM